MDPISASEDTTPPSTLPLEIFLHIASHLPTETLSVLSRTSHTLHTLLHARLAARFAPESFSIALWAARCNDPAILDRALAHIDPATSVLDPVVLLFEAVQCGHVEAVRVLLARGFDPSAWSSGGVTALYVAAKRGDLHMAWVLVEAGACVGWSRLWLLERPVQATREGRHEVMRDMLRDYFRGPTKDWSWVQGGIGGGGEIGRN